VTSTNFAKTTKAAFKYALVVTGVFTQIFMTKFAKVNDPLKDKEETTLDLCGLYYKPMMIVNDNFRVINKLETSLTDNARVIIYDHHMFIVQATGNILEQEIRI
jgi:hypothetical protein